MLKVLALVAVFTAVPPADSIPGTWQFTGDVGGYALNDTCTIQQNGTHLSGSCTLDGGKPSEISGEVKDGKFTFKHRVDGEHGISTLIFSGSVASSTELTGTITVQEHGIDGAFTARPAPAKP